MAVDVSKIPNNSKFDPVRQAILDLQGEISSGVAGVGSINGVSGSVTLTGVSPITISSSASTSQITVGVSLSVTQNTASGTGTLSYNNGVFTYTPPDLSGFLEDGDLSDYLKLSETGTQTVAGNVVVSGNLTVSGTTTYINTTNLNIGDNIITLNADLPSGTAPTQNAGIEINRGSSTDKTFLWDETADKWTLGSETLVAGTFQGNLTGNAATATNADKVDGKHATDFTLDYVTDNNNTTTNTVSVGGIDLTYQSASSKIRLQSGSFQDSNDRYEILATGNSLFFQYWDNDQGNGTSLQKVILDLDGTGSQREATLYGDLRLKSGNVANPTYDAVVLDLDTASGHVDITNVRNGTFSGDLTASTNLIVQTTNVYDNLPDGISWSDTDNRLKIGVSKNVGGTTETAIQPILLANLLTEGYVPYVAAGGAGSSTVNSKVSNSWLKVTTNTLELGASDPISHEIKYARFLWQSGQNDKISTVYGARDITASIQYLGGSKTAKIEFTTGSGGGRIQFNDEYTFPAADGTSGQVLSTNGSGDLSWVNQSGGSGITDRLYLEGGDTNSAGTTFWWRQGNSSSAGGTWRKVCDVDIPTGLWAALSMDITYYYSGSNHGASASLLTKKYSASFRRSNGTQDGYNDAILYGDDNVRVRIVKIGTGDYELQARAYNDNFGISVKYVVTGGNANWVTPATSIVAGNTTGTAYTASPNAATDLELAGDIVAKALYDADNTAYYIDPNGTSVVLSMTGLGSNFNNSTVTGTFRASGNLNYFGTATTNNEAEIVVDTGNAGSPQIGFTEHGDASWAIGVDDGDNSFKIHGTANATIPTINNLASPIFELTTSGDLITSGKTFTDGLVIDNVDWNSGKVRIEGASPNIEFRGTDAGDIYWQLGGNGNSFYVLHDTDKDGTFETTYPLQLDSNNSTGKLYGSRIFADNYHPNADKWTIARTLSLTGDVTGTSAAFDGSGNISISTSLADSYLKRNIGTVSGVDNTGYTTAFTVAGDNLSSSIRFSVQGTTSSVVVANLIDLVVNHSEDIMIKAQSGVYTRLYVKVVSNNNEDFAVELKTNSANAVTLNLEVLTYGGEVVTFTNTHSFTGATLEHDCVAGFSHKGMGGNTGDISTTGNVVASNMYVGEYVYHNDDTNTYLRMLGDQIQLVAGGRIVINLDEGTDPDKIQIGDSATYTYTDGRLGINTSTPTQDFHVVGSALFGESSDVTYDAPVKIRNSADGFIGMVRTGVRTWAHNIGSNGHYYLRNVDGTYNVFEITDDNKVGIGKTPSYQLDVAASIRAGDNLYIGTGGGFFYNDSGSRIRTNYDFYTNNSNTYLYANNLYLGDGSGDNIRVRGNRMFGNNWEIDTDGSAGFGTASAGAQVHIVDNTFPQLRVNDDTGGGEAGMRIRSYNGTIGLHSDIYTQVGAVNEVGRLSFRVPWDGYDKLNLYSWGGASFGTAGNGTNVGGRWLSFEGNTDASGEGSGRLFFSEHNSTTTDMDKYGMSIGYRGGGTTITTAGGGSWTGLSQIGNGQWGMWGHNADVTGSLIMYGDRQATFVNFNSNDIREVNYLYAGRFLSQDNSAYHLDVADSSWRVTTASGYIDIGPKNTSWCHIYTDRAAFYTNKEIYVNNQKVLHTGNEGSGGGIDADTVDGLQASQFLRSDASDSTSGDLTVNGHIYGRSVNGQYSNLYRMGGIYFTWDSDSYGTNFNHSITSTDNGVYGDDITINSYGNVRVNIDSNGNGTNTFTIGRHTTGTANTLLTLNESGNLVVTGTVSGTDLFVAGYIYHAADTNTYIRMIAADDMQLVCGGRQMLRMDEGTDPDKLRFTTDNSWTNSSGQWRFHDRVGINSDPQNSGAANAKLYIVGGAYGDKCIQLVGSGYSSIGAIEMPANCSGITVVNGGASGQTAFAFVYGTSTQVGRIAINSTSTSYVTTSDYRLKENLVDITDGIDRLKLLKPKRFNFIGHEEVVDGFVAHEAQEVVPEAVTGEKDGIDWEGNPDYQGIDQAKLVPLLTAALQEAVAKIELLEARVSQLENNV